MRLEILLWDRVRTDDRLQSVVLLNQINKVVDMRAGRIT
jgi:hypothetical protein